MLDVGDDADGALGLELGDGLAASSSSSARLDAQVDGQRHRLAAGAGRADLVVEGALGAGQALRRRCRRSRSGGRPRRPADRRGGPRARSDTPRQGQVVDAACAPAGVRPPTTIGAAVAVAAPAPGASAETSRQGARAAARRGLGRSQTSARVDVEAVVGQVGGQQARRCGRPGRRARPPATAPRRRAPLAGEQRRARGAPTARVTKTAAKSRQDEEDADAGVVLGRPVGRARSKACSTDQTPLGQPARTADAKARPGSWRRACDRRADRGAHRGVGGGGGGRAAPGCGAAAAGPSAAPARAGVERWLGGRLARGVTGSRPR